MKVRAELIDGRLVVPVPALYAAHLKLEPRALLDLRATREGFFVAPAESKSPTSTDVARALGGSPKRSKPPEPVPASSVSIDAEHEAALRALVARYEDVLRELPS